MRRPCTGVELLRALLLECLWAAFVGPILFWPLIQEDVAVQHIAALSLTGASGPSGGGGAGAITAAGAGGAAAGGRAVLAEAAPGAHRAVQRGTVGPLCSLYVFERLFLAVTDGELLKLLVSALLGGAAACAPGSTGASPAGSLPGSRPGSPGDGAPSQQPPAAAASASGAAAQWRIPLALLARLQYSPAAYRQALLGMLRGTDAQVAAAAVRVLASLLRNRAVSEEQLELIGKLTSGPLMQGRGNIPSALHAACGLLADTRSQMICQPLLSLPAPGLLPQRRRKQRQLLKALVSDSPLSSHMLEPAAVAEVEEEVGGESELRQQEAAQQDQQQGAEGQEGQEVGARQQAAQDQRGHGQSLQEGDSRGQGEVNGPSHAQQDEPLDFDSGSMLACNGATQPANSSHSSSGSSNFAGSPAVHLSLSEASDGLLKAQLLPCVSGKQQELPALPASSLQAAPQHGEQQQAQQAQQQRQAQQGGRRQGPAAAAGTAAEAAFSDIVSALLGPLTSDLLPPLSLRAIGWLLHQLLSMGKGGTPLSAGQRGALAQAAARHRAALQQQLQGRWADALAPMVAAEWRRCREDILRAGAGSVHVAVQTWMQVGPAKGLQASEHGRSRRSRRAARCRAGFPSARFILVLPTGCLVFQELTALGQRRCVCYLAFSPTAAPGPPAGSAGAGAPLAAGRASWGHERARPGRSGRQARLPGGSGRCGAAAAAAGGRGGRQGPRAVRGVGLRGCVGLDRCAARRTFCCAHLQDARPPCHQCACTGIASCRCASQPAAASHAPGFRRHTGLLFPACLPPQVLCEGDIPADPPCPPVSDADVRRGEVREQAQIALAQSQRMHCTVCFTRGQERQAYFAVEGLPAHMKAGHTAGGRAQGGGLGGVYGFVVLGAGSFRGLCSQKKRGWGWEWGVVGGCVQSMWLVLWSCVDLCTHQGTIALSSY